MRGKENLYFPRKYLNSSESFGRNMDVRDIVCEDSKGSEEYVIEK